MKGSFRGKKDDSKKVIIPINGLSTYKHSHKFASTQKSETTTVEQLVYLLICEDVLQLSTDTLMHAVTYDFWSHLINVQSNEPQND